MLLYTITGGIAAAFFWNKIQPDKTEIDFESPTGNMRLTLAILAGILWPFTVAMYIVTRLIRK
tara:strand:+ start:818 stop:1006 length:189 start_codon:yes stop_codon:yes gene_type:complete